MSKTELLVVNKFGKQEAEDKGLTGAIAAALDRSVPVLVGVNGLNLPAFLEFAGGMASELTPEAENIVNWCLAALASANLHGNHTSITTPSKPNPQNPRANNF